MSKLERRLRKVEAAFPAIEHLITREELHIAKLRLVLAMYERYPDSEIVAGLEKLATKFTNKILSTAKKHQEEQFKQHLAEHVQPIWKIRCGQDEFLPPVCGSEYDDWEVPNLYQRRVAIRHFPLVVALIGAPDEALGPPKYVIRWEHVIDTILQWVDNGTDRPIDFEWSH